MTSLTRLTAILDEVLGSAGAVAGSLRPRMDAVRDALAADVTVVVTGRRGCGKTTAVNSMLAAAVGAVGYSVEDRPVQIIGAREEKAVPWAVATRVSPTVARGRRFVELPEHLSCPDSDGVRRVAGLAPDVVVHVTRGRLRSDETELLRRAQVEWRIQPLEVVLVASPADRLGSTTSPEELPHRFEAAMRLVEAGRCRDVMNELPLLAARSDDAAWAGRLLDDLERVSLSVEAHVIRERWALEAALGHPDDVPEELRDDLLRLTLGGPGSAVGDAEALRARAAQWRAQLPLMAPLAAEVARVVTRTIQLRIGGPALRASTRGEQP